MKPVLVHTTNDQGEWHVYLGFCIESQPYKTANLVIADGFSLRFLNRMEHLDHRISAHYYVWVPEVERMVRDIAADVNQRGIGNERMDDIEEIVELLKPSGEGLG